MRDPSDWRRGWLWGALAALGAVHLGLLAWGAFDPEASLRFDRTGRRLASARMLVEAVAQGRADEVGALLRSRGAPGDYAWHALVLGPTGGSLLAVQTVQLLLAGLSLVALHRIALAVDGRREVAWLAVVVYAAIPIDLMIPHFLASEAFFNPLLVLGCAALARYATEAADLRTLTLAGVAFGLAGLTRPEGLPWLLVMAGAGSVLARRRAPGRAALHATLLAVLSLGGAALYLASAPAEPVRLDRASLSLQWELANRAQRVISAAGGDATGIEAAPVASFVRAAVAHPASFAREFALQAGKLLALPDNLDAFRYLGLYEFTGRRSDWVHELGILGAVRRSFQEMPVLTGWLLATTALWLCVGGLALRGAARALAGSRGARRLLVVLLVSLPVLWTALRVLTQGESRKRSPVDFAIALFAAIGIWRARSGRATPGARCD